MNINRNLDQHWHRVLNPKICKKPWSLEEDRSLADRVAEFGESSWKKVAEGIKGRTDIQCRHRWIMLKKYESQGKGRPMSRTNKTKNTFVDGSDNSNSSNGTLMDEEDIIVDLKEQKAHVDIFCTPPRKIEVQRSPIPSTEEGKRIVDEQILVCDEEGFDEPPPTVTPRSFFRSIKLENSNIEDEEQSEHSLHSNSEPIVINKSLPHSTCLSMISPNSFPVTFSTSETFKEFFGSPKSGAKAAHLRHMMAQDPDLMVTGRQIQADQLFEQAYQEINDYFVGNSVHLSHMTSPNHSHSNLLHSIDIHHHEEFLH